MNQKSQTKHKPRPYQICIRCVMDTTDPEIQFDKNGVCNHCRGYEEAVQLYMVPEARREAALHKLVAEIKAYGRGKEYDCAIGVSGGVDSTYVAYLVRQFGLRPLAVHMDNGWDSELAVSNIEKVLKRLEIDLHTHVLDWEEFRDLQVAFLKASVPDAEIPTDHAIWAVLHKVAAERELRYILLGANVATEHILPRSWTYGIMDWRYIRSIHRKFGRTRLRTFPHIGFWGLRFYYPFIKGIRTINVLDFINYDKKEAMRILQGELGWRPYGGKHYESIYTRIFQGYILPTKFGIDKRRAHLSTLIMSGQTSRAEASRELDQPAYAGYMPQEDKEYLLKKFGFKEHDFEGIMGLAPRSYRDYPNSVFHTKLYMGTVQTIEFGKWMRRIGLRPSSPRTF
jgi:N-acetyl sugar amidotransferase